MNDSANPTTSPENPRGPTMRQAVLNAWARLLHNYTILVPTIIFCALVAGTLWHLSRLSSNLIQSSALQAASMHAASLKEVRKLYTSEVTDRVEGHGIQITHDYATKEGAIPLPATFSMELGKRISEQSTGMQARLYSDFPFPWRKDGGPRDDFEREAIHQLRQFPDQPFYRFEDFQGRPSLRYAVADRMEAGCVSCHNSHPDSPKKNWKLGDVRGVLEITRPLDSIIAQTHAGLRETFALMAIIGTLGLIGLAKLRQSQAAAREREISDQERSAVMQAELARVSRLTTMGQMAASIAHEINQPLAGVVNNANAGLRWLTNRPPNIDEVRAALRRIVNDGERGSGIIESIRAMLKKDDRKRVKLDLNELIRDVMRLSKGQFQRHGVSIRSELADNLPTVSADRVQLQQVILNLLMNAAEATASNSNQERLVCVRSEKHDSDWVRISVEDSGTGIKPEDEKRIFEAFFTTKTDGMGMGLSICRSIVQSHGGRITAARAMSRGSVFQVTLPGGRT
ncbi:MAG TPA: ATP-binding protein [Candidatus Binatia bacterium]|nr:ATP-binding protein [Candidatus Binatia bacterium]